MRTVIRILTGGFATLAIGGAIAAASVAVAAPTVPPPTAPTQTPAGEGTDPLVSADTAANPFMYVPK